MYCKYGKICHILLLVNHYPKKKDFMNNINGITISPKKSFCIVKLWTKSLDFQNPRDIISINGLQVNGCLFKKHKSSY